MSALTQAETQAAGRVLDALAPSPGFKRGVLDAYQDQCEGCPMASVGATTVPPEPGLIPRAPHWVLKDSNGLAERERHAYVADYLRGYDAQARAQ